MVTGRIISGSRPALPLMGWDGFGLIIIGFLAGSSLFSQI